MGATSSTITKQEQEGPRKYGTAGESGIIIATFLYRPSRSSVSTESPITSSVTSSITSVSNKSSTSSSSTSAVIAVGRETVDLFSTITGDRRLQRNIHPSGSIYTCAEARSDSILGPILALGSDTGEISIVNAATLDDIKVIKVCANTVGVTKPVINGREIVTVASVLSSSSSSSLSYSTPKPRSNTLTNGVNSSPNSSFNSFLRITAISIVTSAVLLVGFSDGSARSYSLSTSELLKSFGPPPPPSPSSSSPQSTSSPTQPQSTTSVDAIKRVGEGTTSLNNISTSRDVVALAVYNTSPVLLAIGRSDGSIDKYDVESGKYLTSFKTAPGLLCLIPMLRLNCLACVHSLQNSMTIWDAAADRVIQLDFSAELQSIGRRLSKMTFARFDEYRSVLLCGDDAGSIFTRRVSRINETSDLAVKLVRVAAPAPTASAPTRVTSMWYDSRSDSGFTGDASGLVRVVSSASGVSIKDIREDVVKIKSDVSTLGKLFEELLQKKGTQKDTIQPNKTAVVITRPLALTVNAALVNINTASVKAMIVDPPKTVITETEAAILPERILQLKEETSPLPEKIVQLKEESLPLTEKSLPLIEKSLPLIEKSLPLIEETVPLSVVEVEQGKEENSSTKLEQETIQTVIESKNELTSTNNENISTKDEEEKSSLNDKNFESS
jgi:hypothetical protein